ncbi:hypothetical protein TSUD_321150 [Trifolium subterraneum]|uniref:Pentacotripeptide-repeat region of PRORP domain-containing protein n=1 Tax=Trifolium subterraneum TaxID=3900 RepID=A0A2Z6N7Q9_TRISU|nr:hypothetical protein TSUD_321150 [Trifolium subterraneum]
MALSKATCRKSDTALEHFKQFILIVKGLIDNNKVDRAMDIIKDPLVYHYLMLGYARNSDGDAVLRLYEDLKGKLGGVVEDGVVLGSLMKGYFLKGMENEAMECYQEVFLEGKKMSDIAYSSVLNALAKNGKFDEALKLLDRMIKEHNPPAKLVVNLGSFNVMVDGYCAQGRFKEANQEAEEVYGEIEGEGVNPDEYTYGLLMDICFEESRPDDAADYFRKMVESSLRPNLAVYNRMVDGYQLMMKVLSEAGRLDDVLQIIDMLLDDNGVDFDEEFQEFVKAELRKEGREEDLTKLMDLTKAEAKAKEAEATEAAKKRVGSGFLLTSKLFGNKETESESAVATPAESSESTVATTMY